MTTIKALGRNPGCWREGQIFECVADDDGHASIRCNKKTSHALLDMKDEYLTLDKIAECPDFEVVEDRK